MTTTTTERPRRSGKAATPPAGEGEGENGGAGQTDGGQGDAGHDSADVDGEAGGRRFMPVFDGARVARADLVRASTVASVVESRNTMPILSNMLVEAGGAGLAEQVALTATDLDIAVRLVVPAQVDGAAIATTVAAARFATLVGSSDDGCEITLAHQAGDRDLHLRAGRGRFKLPVLPREDYPLPRFEPGAANVTIGAAALAAALGRTAFAECKDESRYWLQGTALLADGDRLSAVATNVNVMAAVSLGDHGAGWQNCILPAKLTRLIVRLMKDGDGDAVLTLDEKGEQLRIAWGEWTITSKLLVGNFPHNWRKVIDECGDERRVSLDSAAFQRAIRRVVEMSNEKTRIVAVTFDADRLTLSASSADYGSAEEEIPATCAVEEMTMKFIAGSLMAIAASASGDSFTIDLPDNVNGHVRVMPAVGEDFAGMISPIQQKGE